MQRKMSQGIGLDLVTSSGMHCSTQNKKEQAKLFARTLILHISLLVEYQCSDMICQSSQSSLSNNNILLNTINFPRTLTEL